MWYLVSGIFEGALDEERIVYSEEEMEKAVDEIEALYQSEGDKYDWQIYVITHYCDLEDEDEECICAQYLTDHHPWRESA